MGNRKLSILYCLGWNFYELKFFFIIVSVNFHTQNYKIKSQSWEEKTSSLTLKGSLCNHTALMQALFHPAHAQLRRYP